MIVELAPEVVADADLDLRHLVEEVEHGRLRALEEDVLAVLEGLLDDRIGVFDVGIERPRIAEVLVQHLSAVERLLVVEAGQDRVLELPDHEVDLLAHEAFLLEVADPEPDPPDLVRIGGPDATPGRAETIVSARRLLEAV